MAVSALGDAAKDGAIPRRHLLRHQAKPGSKVTPFAKGSAIADRGPHRTRDDRADPWNRDQLLAAFVSVRQGLDLIRYPFDALIEIFPIGHKVRNDPADYPPVARTFKDDLAAVNAVLFVTPEYNPSIPGGLKNAIDWASRPYGKNSFTRKPSAVIGTSPGSIGTAVAQQSLRSVLSFCNSPQMNAPAAYIHARTCH